MATRTARPSAVPRPGQDAVDADGGPSATGWMRGIRVSWFTFVMMGLIVIGVLIIAPTLQLYLGQRNQISDLQRQNAATSSEITKLKSDAARWSDPSYIRAQARDRLLYVMPGETSYLVIDDRPPSAAAKQTPVSDRIQKTQTDWLTTLLGSVITAGTTTSPADELSGADTGNDGSAPKKTPAHSPSPSR